MPNPNQINCADVYHCISSVIVKRRYFLKVKYLWTLFITTKFSILQLWNDVPVKTLAICEYYRYFLFVQNPLKLRQTALSLSVVISNLNNYRTSSNSVAVFPIPLVVLSVPRIAVGRFAASVSALGHGFRFRRLDCFHRPAVSRRNGLLAETLHRVSHAGT